MAQGGAAGKQEDIRRLVEEWTAGWEAHRPYRDAFGIEYNYALHLKQHDPAKAQGRMQVVSLDVTDIVRYNSNEIAGTAVYLDVEAEEPAENADAQAELDQRMLVVRTAFGRKVHDLDLGYPAVRRKVIRCACAARMGAAVLELVTGADGITRVIPRLLDPRDLTWDPRFGHFNEPGCPRLYHRLRMTKEDLETAGWWKDGLKPDNGAGRTFDVPSARNDAALSEWEKHHPLYTILQVWDREAGEQMEVEVSRKLEDPERFMACPTCGYSEAELVGASEYDGTELPEWDACPQCGMDEMTGDPVSMMRRVDVRPEKVSVDRWERKSARRIIAPYCPEAGYLLEEPWPAELLSFPYMMYFKDPLPLEHGGNSDTFLHMSMNSFKNAALRQTMEQFARNQDLTIVHDDLLHDAKGDPYQHDGSGDYLAYTEYTDVQGRIYHHQGSGMSPAAPAVIGLLNQELAKYRGVDQMAFSPETIKGTPVGTLAQAQETGRVPLDEAIRIWRETEEQFLQRWLELLVGNSNESEWVLAQEADGTRVWRRLSWTEIAGMRVKVLGKPRLDFVARENVEALKGLIGLPPVVIRLLAAASDLPPSQVEELIKAFEPPPGMGMPGAEGMGLPGGGAAGVERQGQPAPPVPPGLEGMGGGEMMGLSPDDMALAMQGMG